MLLRLLRIAASFACVLAAYFGYARVVVPYVEPPADERRTEGATEAELEAARSAVARRIQQLEQSQLFPPGSWELKTSKILESDTFWLLLEGYKNVGDGRVSITPCTMIFFPSDEKASSQQRMRRAVVLQAPKGLLEFDEALELQQGRIGRLLGGGLMGDILIRSQGKKPGPEDDLRIVTRDVELTEKQVYTPQPVDFRLGPNFGRGRTMTIRLLPGESSAGSRKRGPDIGGIESFTFEHLDRLHLELDDGDLFAGLDRKKKKKDPQEPAAPEGSAVAPPYPSTQTQSPAEDSSLRPIKPKEPERRPVEVRCRGPFHFHVVERLATLEDDVQVFQLHPDGQPDSLSCRKLSIYFQPRAPKEGEEKTEAPAGAAKSVAGPLDLEPRQIKAEGEPVEVRVPSRDAFVRAEDLAYDLVTGQIDVAGRDEVVLRQAQSEVHARSVQYLPVGDGHTARITAVGPGWLRGTLRERPGQQLYVQWLDRLWIRPDDRYQVRPGEPEQLISVLGKAQVRMASFGRLDADQIHFWLYETPPIGPKQKRQQRPARMLAQGNVRLDSLQVSGTVEVAKVWFDDRRPLLPEQDAADPRSAPPGGQGLARLLPPTTTAGVAQTAGLTKELSVGRAMKEHFEITGGELHAQVVLKEKETELANLYVQRSADREVRLRQTRTAKPGDQPVVITGDRIDAEDVGDKKGQFTVSGQPAHFEGRGFGLTGANIHLDQQANRLWVDGAGWMDLVVDRDLQGRPLAIPQPARIRWQKQMDFDGRIATFTENVSAATPDARVATGVLEVHFWRPIRFADVDDQPKPEIHRILCRGQTSMENRVRDELGVAVDARDQVRIRPVVSIEQTQANDVAIDLVTGAMTAAGPGWVRQVRRGKPEQLAELASGRNKPERPAPSPKDADGLTYLKTSFQRELTANFHDRQMVFTQRVETVYGPVQAWDAELDPDNPDSLGPEGMVMTSDRLMVTQMLVPGSDAKSIELEATGNAVVEGRLDGAPFTARANRMSYCEAKDLVVMEGDGRSDVELYQQSRVGSYANPTTAQKIYFWRSRNDLKLVGGRGGQWTGSGGR